jgi:hypothetical protein
MALVSLPLIFWATRDTPTTVVDILKISMRPLLCIVTGAAVTWSAWSLIHLLTQPLVRLTVACAILFGVHAFVLRFVMGQKATYANCSRALPSSTPQSQSGGQKRPNPNLHECLDGRRAPGFLNHAEKRHSITLLRSKKRIEVG